MTALLTIAILVLLLAVVGLVRGARQQQAPRWVRRMSRAGFYRQLYRPDDSR